MVMSEVVRVKLKMLRRPQEVRDARKMKHVLRKATGNEWNQPKKEGHMGCKAIRVGLPKPIGAHSHLVSTFPGSQAKSAGFKVCPAGF
jgi:hypothetical protein